MGGMCTGERQAQWDEYREQGWRKYDEYSVKAKEQYEKSKVKAGEASVVAKQRYEEGKVVAKIKYEEGKLKMKGFKVEDPHDRSYYKSITNFELKLPLVKISLDEFERRLKKLIDREDDDCITEQQLVEVLKDHYALTDIVNEDNIVRRLLTDPVMYKPDTQDLYIPYLLLLGCLYCASNPKNKSEKFFELCQIDLDPFLSRKDPEFVDYFPKLLEISGDLMIRMYRDYKLPEDEMPKHEWFLEEDQLSKASEEVMITMMDEIFKTSNQIENPVFIHMLQGRFMKYLQAHELRKMLFDTPNMTF